MSDDYLWDKSGTPDPEVERLEKLLSQFRHDQPAPEFAIPVRVMPPPRRRLLAALAAAAAVALVAVGTWLATRPGGPAWEVKSLAGAPKVGSSRIGDAGRIGVGQLLETDADSRARINVGMIGEVEVEPNTRIRLLQAHPTDHRLGLERGRMHARIWAPPRLFFVETPSALAVDLGCVYTLSVDAAGTGLLHVRTGWVAFERDGRESFVPAGAMCATRPGIGPGAPFFEDASARFRAALERLDFDGGDPAARAAALEVVLAESRPQDALTLWHLLTRTNGTLRGAVFDRLAALARPPQGVTREGVLAGDKKMLDRWWDELGFGVTSWWRMWKGGFPTRTR
jgi:ferric-dicitrate binding protein FerR (iron transport regulator)